MCAAIPKEEKVYRTGLELEASLVFVSGHSSYHILQLNCHFFRVLWMKQDFEQQFFIFDNLMFLSSVCINHACGILSYALALIMLGRIR